MARTQSKLTLNCTCYSTFDHNLRSHMFCEILFIMSTVSLSYCLIEENCPY